MSHPFIVLEGPDCVGKTTLAKALMEKLGHDATYLHLIYRFRNNIFLYHLAALEQCIKNLQDGPVVLDRWWPSEICYAAAFRGGSDFPEEARMLDRVGMRYGALYVVCRPESRKDYAAHHAEVKEARYKAKKHALAGREGLVDDQARVWDLYGDCMTWMGAKRLAHDVTRYDWMKEGRDLDEVCDRIVGSAQRLQFRKPAFWNDPNDRTFCGSPDAKIVIMADQPVTGFRRDTWPFVGLTAECQLPFKIMEELGVHECDQAWCNSHVRYSPWPTSDHVSVEEFERRFKDNGKPFEIFKKERRDAARNLRLA